MRVFPSEFSDLFSEREWYRLGRKATMGSRSESQYDPLMWVVNQFCLIGI
jgi:hypothetical protein